MQEEYTIEKHDCLSNDSMVGFYECDTGEVGIWWPSVSHYLEAKKFEGTQYESVIRNTKTSRQAKRMTRERSITIISSESDPKARVMYGVTRNGYTPIENWNELRRMHVYKALVWKFSQPRMKQKLVGTYPSDISYPTEPQTAEVLMELRNQYINP